MTTSFRGICVASAALALFSHCAAADQESAAPKATASEPTASEVAIPAATAPEAVVQESDDSGLSFNAGADASASRATATTYASARASGQSLRAMLARPAPGRSMAVLQTSSAGTAAPRTARPRGPAKSSSTTSMSRDLVSLTAFSTSRSVARTCAGSAGLTAFSSTALRATGRVRSTPTWRPSGST